MITLALYLSPLHVKEGETNVGVSEETGTILIEITGLKGMSPEAARICHEDLNEGRWLYAEAGAYPSRL